MSDTADLAAAIAGLSRPVAAPIQQTSIDDYVPSEVTVRFRKWTAFNGTAYMRGQQAGFPRAQIAELERRGIVEVVQGRETAAGMRRAVTK